MNYRTDNEGMRSLKRKKRSSFNRMTGVHAVDWERTKENPRPAYGPIGGYRERALVSVFFQIVAGNPQETFF